MPQFTTALFPQLRAMSDFAAVRGIAAFGPVWSAVGRAVLTPNGIDAGAFGNLPSSSDDHARFVRFREKVIKKVRPTLDRQVMRFVDEESPFNHEALALHGFDSPSQVIRFAHAARAQKVLSFEPAEVLIASALALIEGERASIQGLDLYPGIKAKRASGGELLDRDEKIFLLESAKAGDNKALDWLILFYMPLIAGIAHKIRAKFGNGPLTDDELIQIGRVEFSTIVRLYEASLASFETYVKRSLPLRLRNAVVQNSRSISREVSLNAPLGDRDDRTYEDLIEDTNVVYPEDDFLDLELREKLFLAIEGSGLEKREKIALFEYYLEELTYEQVGEMLAVSRQMASNLSKSGIGKILRGSHAADLRDLL